MAAGEVFHWLDFVVFAVFLLMSIMIGVYHAWNSRRIRRTATSDTAATDEFLMGGRNMPVAPVALSLLTTFLSGVTMLGTPAEIYRRGLLFWLYYMVAVLAFLTSGVFFVPIFYKLRSTSIYEFFGHRFNSYILRKIAASIFLVHALFYMSIVLYAPAAALSGITGYSLVWFVLVVGFTCTLYTTIGGLKAVVWTDTLQAAFMYTGIFTLLVRGVIVAGGLEKLYETTVISGRIDALKRIDLNPAQYSPLLQHNSVWISIFGAWSFWMSLYGVNQMALQRYCSLPSLRHAYAVIKITIPLFVVLGSLACFVGVVMLGSFYYCDPIQTKRAANKDQFVILFATDVLNFLPGMSGLFLATLFSCTLSTVSSGMNSMAAVLWEDFLKEHLAHRFNDDTAARLNKGLVLLLGCGATALSFLAQLAGGVMRSAFSGMGAISGPLVGLFLVGVFCPRTSKMAAFISLSVGVIVTMGIFIGATLEKPYAEYTLPTNSTCKEANGTVPKILSYDGHYGKPDVIYPFRISPYLYPFIGNVIVVVLAVVLSYVLPEDEDTEAGRARKRSLTYWGRDEPFIPPEGINRTRTEIAELNKIDATALGETNGAFRVSDATVLGETNGAFRVNRISPIASGYNPTIAVPDTRHRM